MRKKRSPLTSFSFSGAITFFILIALTMQFAILLYEYICKRTTSIPLLAVLILIEIIIISAFCTFIDWIRRKFTVERPTKRILDATEKIAQGDFSVRLDIYHDDSKYNQYDLIMENLNKMAAELQKTEVLKVDFISNVSHEIKTPLAVIQNYSTLIQNENLSAQERKEYAKILKLASKRITDLITNILRLNKLENQEIQEKKEVFNVTEALSESIVDFLPLMENKNINLECDLDDIRILSNKSLLEIIWNNLISNAVKFTPNGGSINISLKKQENDLKIEVKDSGCGISPEVGARIFEKFFQGDTSHAAEGNGLGLALVKRVIDILGGEITVNSEINKGSTFTVTLPECIEE